MINKDPKTTVETPTTQTLTTVIIVIVTMIVIMTGDKDLPLIINQAGSMMRVHHTI